MIGIDFILYFYKNAEKSQAGNMDIKTVIFFLVFINLFLGCLLMLFYRLQKTYPGFRYWASSHILIGISYFLIALRGVVPDIISILLANLIIVPVGLFRLKGVSRFFGKNLLIMKQGIIFSFLILISFSYFTYYHNSGVIRNFIISLFIIYICFYIVVVYIQNRKQISRAIFLIMVVIFPFYSKVLGTRSIYGLLNPSIPFLFGNSFLNSFFFTSLLLLDIAWAVLFLMMNNYRLSENLSIKNHELSEMNRVKDKFFAVIAHDLKNPIYGISGVVDLIKMDMDEENYDSIKESIFEIKNASDKVKLLLENLLNWAKTQIGGIVYHPILFDLNLAIDENIQQIRQISNNKNINIEKLGNFDYQIKADKNMFHSVIRNILTNAIKFSYAGTNIEIQAEEKDNQILISQP